MAATNAAYLHLAATFHEQGVLGDILEKDSALKKSMKKSTKEELKSVWLDIYNYAARFDLIPTVNRATVNRKERQRVRKYMQVTVELAEQDIKVTATGIAAKEAEARAGQLFKKEAEKYHAERGGGAIVIKDSGALTTDNAHMFFHFYRMARPGSGSAQDMYEEPKNAPPRVTINMSGEPLGEPIEVVGTLDKKMATRIAWLTAAIAMKRREPDLYPRYLQALKNGNGQILATIAPVNMPVDEDCSLIMRETMLAARRAGLPDEVRELAPDIGGSETRSGGNFHRYLTPDKAAIRSQELQQKLNADLQNPAFEDPLKKKADLPMNQYKEKVLKLVNENVYSIIVGATGSGKTTQVPQILLEEYIKKGIGSGCNIICTQPRRIAATSVARRVAEERFESLQDTVGYRIRFDSRPPRQSGSITYCTTGVLLQSLQRFPDEVMDHHSHFIIDEIHERDLFMDFLLILLKKNVKRRLAQGKSVPQVVLMSATMDTELFASYFQNDVTGKGTTGCPSLSVPGRTFPVREKYLDEVIKEVTAASPAAQLSVMHADPGSRDYLQAEERFRNENKSTSIQHQSNASTDEVSVIDWKRERKLSADGVVVDSNSKEDALVPIGLIACTIAHVVKTSQDGAILVFLPGLEEMLKVKDLLQDRSLGVDFSDSRFRVILLHSSMPQSHAAVFEPVPDGCRKIILATNIAETSVTIPDVQYVVDTGKLREMQYDQIRRISSLVCTWVSKSNAKQRAGRAGRVQNGNYYALYTKQRYETLRAIGLPELLRSDLQEICLQIKAQAFQTPIREFLAEAVEAPPPSSVDKSVINLQALDALTDNEDITPLGRLLASLPVHPTLGKMILLGIIFRCFDAMLILGASSTSRSLFLSPLERRAESQDAKLSFVQGSGSDHIALLNAVRELRCLRQESCPTPSLRNFASSNFLHFNTFETIDATAAQIEDILVEAGLIPRTPAYARLDHQYGAPSLNENSRNVPLIKALVMAGVHPNLALCTGGRLFRTPGEKNAMLHLSSINAPHGKTEQLTFNKGSLFSYNTMSRSNDGNTIFLKDTTQSTPLMAALFGGRLRRRTDSGNILEIDDWLPFYVQSSDYRTPKTIFEFRKALERLLVTAFTDLGKISQQRKSGSEVARSQKQRNFGVDDKGNLAPAEGTQQEPQYLADDRAREIFANGLVDVLDRDVRTTEKVALRGWGRSQLGDAEQRGRQRTTKDHYDGGGKRWSRNGREQRGRDGSSQERREGNRRGEGSGERGNDNNRRRRSLPRLYDDMLTME